MGAGMCSHLSRLPTPSFFPSMLLLAGGVPSWQFRWVFADTASAAASMPAFSDGKGSMETSISGLFSWSHGHPRSLWVELAVPSSSVNRSLRSSSENLAFFPSCFFSRTVLLRSSFITWRW
uniref:Putative secreted protein n=1 Tax=Ixodes ricinus TaxID=34613 RepID=A0A6B0UN00_IXORI